VSCLPPHGRVSCTKCHGDSPVKFDETRRTDGEWRITANPLAWGNPNADIVVLGFSKGPTQAGALASAPHDEIAYRGGRLAVGKILAHIGLIPEGDAASLRRMVDNLIAARNGRFHFGSLVRCTVEKYDRKADAWKGSGGGMLDKFVATPFGSEVTTRCTATFLSGLPPQTKLVVMFGLGSRGNYVREAKRVISSVRPETWRDVNEVAYTDGKITVVHVEHFAAQGRLLPNWLGVNNHARAALGLLAREAVEGVFIGGNRSDPLIKPI